MLQGLKRGKGTAQSPKSPLLPDHLRTIHGTLNMDKITDMQFWAATLTAFFGLLRVGNITSQHAVLRKDVMITSRGIVIHVSSSKTIQYKQRSHQVVLPYLKDNILCPVSALLRFLSASKSCPSEAQLFTIPGKGRHLVPLSATSYRKRLTDVAKVCHGLDNCSTHSLRRGGATWHMLKGTPLAAIKVLGDWSSDSVFRYLLPNINARFDILQKAVSDI